jgi:predicted nucleic-acid-binding Zn-ribbon protein
MTRPKDCTQCGSHNQLFHPNVDAMGAYGPNLVPGGGGLITQPKIHVVVCKDCGFIRFFATEKTLERITNSKRWERL